MRLQKTKKKQTKFHPASGNIWNNMTRFTVGSLYLLLNPTLGFAGKRSDPPTITRGEPWPSSNARL